MAKGFMIFVEGKKLPKMLHKNFASAFREAKRLSNKYKGKKILLLEYHKTFIVKDLINGRLKDV